MKVRWPGRRPPVIRRAEVGELVDETSCNYFLRPLVRRDLSPSKVGHFAGPASAEQAPDPS
jgi:hypothetical protein